MSPAFHFTADRSGTTLPEADVSLKLPLTARLMEVIPNPLPPPPPHPATNRALYNILRLNGKVSPLPSN